MKNLLITLVLTFVTLVSISQTTIDTYHFNESSQIEFDSSNELDNSFHWTIASDYSTVNCYIYEGKYIVDTLIWLIDEVVYGKGTYRYEVSSFDDRDFIIDFLINGNSVTILNKETLTFSTMSGDVYYE